MRPVPLDALREAGIGPPPIADDDPVEAFSQYLLQDPFASALPDGDQGLAPGREGPGPVILAVHLRAGLIGVDHAGGPYPPEDPLVLGPQPAAYPSGDVKRGRRRDGQSVCPVEGLADLHVGQPFLVLHQGRLNQKVPPEPPFRRAVRMPCDRAGSAVTENFINYLGFINFEGK